jgi:arabinofuranosyltransferase
MTAATGRQPAPDWSSLFFPLSCAACFLYLLSSAWAADDAYITFRVIDNFVHGYGLRWNVDERVQVYTHPLWMWLHIPLYALWPSPVYVTTLVSAITGTLAAYFLMQSAPASRMAKMVLVLLPFALSKSLYDFISSGLEVPLEMCLLGWFWYVFIRFPEKLYRLLFIASLALLARFDALLLLAPPLLLLLPRLRLRALDPGKLALSISPLLLWCGFSLLYYGFVFPNTKYAKLNTGIALEHYMAQGAFYLTDFFSFDPFSFLVIAGALGYCGLQVIRRALAHKEADRTAQITILIAFSMALKLLYLAYVGGDFMAGRFMVPLFYLALFILYHESHARLTPRGAALAAAGMVAVAVLHMSLIPNRQREDIARHGGIADEREYYRDTHAVFYPGTLIPREIHEQDRDAGLAALEHPDTVNKVAVTCCIGVYGFYAGPELTIIDWNALGDPLLARLPTPDPYNLRIGHFSRKLPPGYLHARRTGDTSQMPDDLRRYYEKLRLVTSGALFSMERLKAIIAFHLGAYEPWRRAFIQQVHYDDPTPP